MRATLLALSIVCGLGVAGCGKSDHEALKNDMVSTMERMGQALEGVKDAKSAEAAKPALLALAKEMKDLSARAETIGDPPPDVAARYGVEIASAQRKFMSNMMRVAMNREISKVLDGVFDEMGSMGPNSEPDEATQAEFVNEVLKKTHGVDMKTLIQKQLEAAAAREAAEEAEEEAEPNETVSEETETPDPSAALLQGMLGGKVDELGPKVTDSSLPKEERMSALMSLGMFAASAEKRKEAVPYMVKALDDPEPQLRSTALGLLASYGEDAAPAVPKLIQLLDDKESSATAAMVLGGIGKPAEPAIPKLLEKVEAEKGGAMLFIRALGSLGPAAKDAIPVLETIAASTTPSADKFQAEEALRQIRGEE